MGKQQIFLQKHYKRKIKGNKKLLKKQHLLDHNNPFDDLYYFSREVRMRDGHKCMICDKRRKLTTHHLFSKSKFPKLKYNIANGITLCQKCHTELHLLNDTISQNPILNIKE